ncbi:MAG: hypothetical protein QOK47_1583, partial [Actinomycetota bacterium]|nr:hypothetical protein [Actinomycetota bacterium]
MTEPGAVVNETPTENFFRPLGFGDLLERAFKLGWQNKKAFALIIAVLVIPPNVLLVIALQFLPPELSEFGPGSTPFDGSLDPSSFGLPGILALIALIALIIGSAAANGAGYLVAANAHAGAPVTPKVALKSGLRRVPSVLWVLILSGLLPLLVFALVFAPGFVAVLITQDASSILLLLVMTVLAVGASVALWVLLSLSVPTV